MGRTKKLLAGFFIAAITLLSLGQIGLASFRGEDAYRNLLADGDMEKTTTASWTGYNAFLSKKTTSPHGGSQVVRVAYDGADAWGDAGQTVLTPGKRYHVTGWARGDGTSVPNVILGGSGATWDGGTASTAWQKIDYVGVCVGSATAALFSANLSATHYVEFDDIQVVEVKSNGNVERSAIVDGDMENTNPAVALVDGNMEATTATTTDGGAWSAYQSYISKNTSSPHSGSRDIHLTYNGTNSFGYAYQTLLTNGRTYHVTGWARASAAALPVVYIGTSGAQFWTGTGSLTWQYFDITGVANGTRLSLGASGLTAGHYAEYDDITITDVTAGSWLAGNNATLSKQTTNPKRGNQSLRVAYNGTANPYMRQVIATAGKSYRFSGWARGDGTATPVLYDGGEVLSWTGTNSTAWQRIDFVYLATSQAMYCFNLSSAGYVEFDDIQVVEVKGRMENVQRNLLADGDMENATTANWTPLASGTLTKETNSPPLGRYWLKTAYNGVDYPGGYQTVAVVGKRYRLSGWFKGDGTNFPLAYFGGANVAFGTNSTVWQRFDVSTIADGTLFRLTCATQGFCGFDDVQITLNE